MCDLVLRTRPVYNHTDVDWIEGWTEDDARVIAREHALDTDDDPIVSQSLLYLHAQVTLRGLLALAGHLGDSGAVFWFSQYETSRRMYFGQYLPHLAAQLQGRESGISFSPLMQLAYAQSEELKEKLEKGALLSSSDVLAFVAAVREEESE